MGTLAEKVLELIPELTPERISFIRNFVYETDTLDIPRPYSDLTLLHGSPGELHCLAAALWSTGVFDANAGKPSDYGESVLWLFAGIDLMDWARQINSLKDTCEDQ